MKLFTPKTLAAMLTFAACLLMAASSQAQSAHWFYMFMSDNPTLTIYEVDPADMSQLRALHTSLPDFDTDRLLFQDNVSLSPNGHWAVVSYRNTNDRVEIKKLYLLNLASGESTDIVWDGTSIRALAWSPDSTQIAFTTNDEYGDNDAILAGDLIVYNVLTHQVSNLTNDAALEFAFSWSQSGRQLAVYSASNTSNSQTNCYGCAAELNDIDVSSGKTERIADLTSLLQLTQNDPSELICDLQWSPNDLSLSFYSSCPNAYPLFHSELYVLDLNNRKLTSVTPFSGTSDTPRESFFNIDYAYTWYNANTVFISASVEQGYTAGDAPDFPSPSAPILGSFVYTPNLESLSSLFSDVVSNWLPNSIAGLVAFKRQDSHTTDIAQFTETSLRQIETIPSGCFLSWSPDGKKLSLRNDTPPEYVPSSCGDMTSLLFYDVDSRKTESYAISKNALAPVTEYPMPLGWSDLELPLESKTGD